MRLFFLLLLLLPACAFGIACYEALDLSLATVLKENVYIGNSTLSFCQITVTYDEAPDEIVSVSMDTWPNAVANPQCNFKKIPQPTTKVEDKLLLRVYDFIRITCYCNRDRCNTPGLVMDHLVDKKFITVFEAMKRVWIQTSPQPKKITMAYIIITLALGVTMIVFVCGNMGYVFIHFCTNFNKFGISIFEKRFLSKEIDEDTPKNNETLPSERLKSAKMITPFD